MRIVQILYMNFIPAIPKPYSNPNQCSPCVDMVRAERDSDSGVTSSHTSRTATPEQRHSRPGAANNKLNPPTISVTNLNSDEVSMNQGCQDLLPK